MTLKALRKANVDLFALVKTLLTEVKQLWSDVSAMCSGSTSIVGGALLDE